MRVAKEEQLKDYALLCLEGAKQTKIKSPKLPNGLQAFPQKDPLSHHFFNALFAAEQREAALSFLEMTPQAEVWLNEDALVDKRQVFFFYSPGESNAFVREAEIKTLEQRLKELDTLFLKSEESVQSLLRDRSRKLSERSEQDKTVRKSEMRLVEVNFALQRTSWIASGFNTI